MNLAVFSDSSLACSLTTTVWIGVCILCFCNLSWGFALSGLIVPGILVPLTMTYPLAGALIVVEGLLSWSLALALSRLLPSLGIGSQLFGRDRFFLILLLSILSRVLLEGALLPELFRFLPPDSPQLLDAQSSMSAFGLILVPLFANQLWKPGLRRGLIAFVLVNGMTYLVIQYLLVPYTNFSFTALAMQFDTASRYLPDSPKSYIILMSTVYLASRFNLHYGWDFSGIIFPGLIALALFDPLKIAVTVFETLVIALAATVLLQVKAIRERGLTGANNVLFFFTLAFLYKLALSQTLPHLLGISASEDFLGLGYVMSAVFAMKICRDRSYGFHLTAGLVQVSVLGLGVGLLCSSVLRYVSPQLLGVPQALPVGTQTATQAPAAVQRGTLPAVDAERSYELSLADFVRERLAANPDLFADEASNGYRSPSRQELDALINAVVRPLMRLAFTLRQQNIALDLKAQQPARAYAEFKLIQQQARSFGFVLATTHDPALRSPVAVLMEDAPPGDSRHWGLFATSLGPSAALGLIVSKPLLEYKVLEFGLWSFDQWQANWLLLPLAHPLANSDGSSDLTHPTNRTNLLNAVLVEAARFDSNFKPSVLELRAKLNAERVVRPEEAIQFLATSGEAKEAAIVSLRKFFEARTIPLQSEASVPPTRSFQSNLELGQLPHHTLALPLWVLERMQPLNGPSTWEKNWLALGRSKRRLDIDLALAARQASASTIGQNVRLQLDRYVQSQDPYPLLTFERQHPGLRFELLEDLQRHDQILVARLDSELLFEVQTLTGLGPLARPRPSARPLQSASRINGINASMFR